MITVRDLRFLLWNAFLERTFAAEPRKRRYAAFVLRTLALGQSKTRR
jgi:hypothetical protein